MSSCTPSTGSSECTITDLAPGPRRPRGRLGLRPRRGALGGRPRRHLPARRLSSLTGPSPRRRRLRRPAHDRPGDCALRPRESSIEWGWRTWIELPLVVERPLRRPDRDGRLQLRPPLGAARRRLLPDDRRRRRPWRCRNAQLYEDLRSQVDKDPLTGVLNHRAFYERLEQELARAVRGETQVAVIVVDLDDFKALNDTRGHVAGDEALRRVAAAIRSTCRAVDIPGRLGGDEFAIILPDIVTDLHALAARLLEAIAAQTGLHASVGMAVARKPAPTGLAHTVARADSSLLEAKAAGKHTVPRRPPTFPPAAGRSTLGAPKGGLHALPATRRHNATNQPRHARAGGVARGVRERSGDRRGAGGRLSLGAPPRRAPRDPAGVGLRGAAAAREATTSCGASSSAATAGGAAIAARTAARGISPSTT